MRERTEKEKEKKKREKRRKGEKKTVLVTNDGRTVFK